MAKKMYRTRQEFTYAPTGRMYAVGVEDDLSDWHPNDIKEALRNLIEEVDTHETPPVTRVEGPNKPAEGTHSKDTKELTTNG